MCLRRTRPARPAWPTRQLLRERSVNSHAQFISQRDIWDNLTHCNFISSAQCPHTLEDTLSLDHLVHQGLQDPQDHKGLKVELWAINTTSVSFCVCVSHGNTYCVADHLSGDTGAPGIPGSSRGKTNSEVESVSQPPLIGF